MSSLVGSTGVMGSDEKPLVSRRKLLGEILLELGAIDQDQLDDMVHRKQTTLSHRQIGQIGIRLGYLTKESPEIAKALAKQMGLSFAAADVFCKIPSEVISMVDCGVVTLHHCLPIRFCDEVLTVATDHPEVNHDVLNGFAQSVVLVVASSHCLNEALALYCNYTVTIPDDPPVEEEKPSRPTVEGILASFAGLSSNERFDKLLSLVVTLQVEVYDLRRALMRLDMDF